MRNLAVVIEEMLAAIPKGMTSAQYPILGKLDRARRWLASDKCPEEAYGWLWNAIALDMSALWWLENPNEVEQKLIDIFRGPQKPKFHIVELPRDPYINSGPPPLGMVTRFVQCYCDLPEHQPGDPIVLGHSI